MQVKQPVSESAGQSGFEPIPTRIREIPPLIVEQEQNAIRDQVTEQLANLGQRLATVHRAGAEAYLSQGMYEEARPHAEAAATFAPQNAEYHNQLGFIRYVLGDDAGAIESFEQVLSMQADQPDALFNLGMIRFGSQDFAQAEQCFRRSLQLNANDAETWNNLGVSLHGLGRAADARTCFQQCLQIDPANEDAKINLESV